MATYFVSGGKTISTRNQGQKVLPTSLSVHNERNAAPPPDDEFKEMKSVLRLKLGVFCSLSQKMWRESNPTEI